MDCRLLIPSDEAEVPWLTYSRSRETERGWHRWPNVLNAKNYSDLASKVIDEEMMDDLRQMLMARQAAQSILRNPEMLENAKEVFEIEEESELMQAVGRSLGHSAR